MFRPEFFRNSSVFCGNCRRYSPTLVVESMKYILRFLIFFHRWVGIALCVVFLLWFPSGIGMMYWGFPGVSAEDRLDHSPKLDPARIVLSPEEAAEKAGIV